MNKPQVAAGLDNVPLRGNPRYFVDLVTAELKPQSLLRSTAEQRSVAKGKLIRYACQTVLRMDTADSAAAYMKAVKAQGKPCPSMVCRDTGELITATGEVSNARAPTTFRELLLYFDSLPKSKSIEGQKLEQAIQHLSAIPDLDSAVEEAQVRT